MALLREHGVKKSAYSLAIVGATGLVGREILQVLAERRFPVGELRLYSSFASAGDEVTSSGLSVVVQPLEHADFNGVDVAFLAAGEQVTAECAGRVREAGALGIDLSELFADDLDVPVVVPEVNAAVVSEFVERGLVSSPNPPAIALAVALAPVEGIAGLEHVTAVTFEPVSGAGRAGIEELQRQVLDLMSGRDSENRLFPHRIAFNLLPQVGELLAGGFSRGEEQTRAQLLRILDLPDLRLSVTRVRVPLFFGEAIALSVETREKVTAREARESLRAAPGILLSDDAAEGAYPTPRDSVGQDATAVGRIREHEMENRLDLWISLDNIRKGAAVNAVHIAELLVRDHL
jgi:aspartate-semialdehyde dehydrogenase